MIYMIDRASKVGTDLRAVLIPGRDASPKRPLSIFPLSNLYPLTSYF